MENSTKIVISAELDKYSIAAGSKNKAAQMLGVSVATVSNIVNGKFDSISDELWRNLAAKLGLNQGEWQLAETTQFNAIQTIIADSRTDAGVYGICSNAGSGKSAASKYAKQAKNTFYLCCEHTSRKVFLQKVLALMGKDSGGQSMDDMLSTVIQGFLKLERPVLILDEADKLSDQVLYFFITLYNNLEDHCGLVLMGTDHLEKRILTGCRLNRRGYREVYSRLGGRFIQIPKVSKRDVGQVCKANGLNDDLEITRIWNESEGDLRRVKRLVMTHRKQAIVNTETV